MSASDNTQETWPKPPVGTPAWINILAYGVTRAQKFYEAIFGWKFDTGDTWALFVIPGSLAIRGGICKKDDGRRRIDSDIVLYMMVENVEENLKKAALSEALLVKEKWPAGKYTEVGEFRDTERSLVEVFKWLK